MLVPQKIAHRIHWALTDRGIVEDFRIVEVRLKDLIVNERGIEQLQELSFEDKVQEACLGRDSGHFHSQFFVDD